MSPYDTPEWAAFMAAIRANLADDYPRLMAADWLEEHGERGGAIHASFIRKQIHQHATTVPLTVLASSGLEQLYRVQPHQMSNSGCKVDAIVAPSGTSTTLAFYKRGFITEVRCTLADWVGGECRVCGGRGSRHNDMHYSPDTCPDCKGIGRTRVNGPAIAKAGALERVTITDQKPVEVDNYFTWGLTSFSIPSELTTKFPLGPIACWCCWSTEEAAMDALSVGCIRWAL